MKKYLRHIFSLALILATFFPVTATTQSATQVLDKVVNSIESAPSLALDLSMSVGNSYQVAKLVVERERFKFSGGDMVVYYDGSTQWTHQPSAREVTITTPTLAELAEINPLAFVRNYKANYNVTMKSVAKGTYVVTMTAKKKGLFVKTADVTINTNTWMPAIVKATLSNGQSMTVNVRSVTRGKKHSIDSFRFNKAANPGVEIIDLR